MNNILSSLQYAITPCVLISSNSLLLLSLTNRFSHISTRIRHTDKTHERIFLYKRIRLLRNALLSIVISILLLLLLIITIFVLTIIKVQEHYCLVILFLLVCFFIILSVILFLLDIFYSTYLLHNFIKEHSSNVNLTF